MVFPRNIQLSKALRVLLVGVISILCGVNLSKADNNVFRPIFLNEPTPLNECLDIEKGDDGFIWIANSEGVVRYDGYSVRRYHCQYNFLRSLHKLSGGAIIQLDNFEELGIRRYNPICDDFTKMNIEGDDFLLGAIAECGAVDNHNNLWIGTSRGILCYNDTDGSYHHFEEFRNEEIRTIVAVGDKIAFFVGYDRLYIASPNLEHNRLKIEQSAKTPYNIAPQSALYDPFTRTILIGTLEEGLYTYHIATERFTKQSHLNLDNIPIRALSDFDEDIILIGTDGLGVFKVRRDNFAIVEHYHYTSPYEQSIESNAIYDIYVDSEQRIYAATYAHGVHVLDSHALDYDLIEPQGAHGEPLHSTVNALYEDSDGSLLMGTNNGIYSISKNRQSHKLYSFTKGTESRNKVVLTIQGFDGELYAGGYGSGLLRVDRAHKTLRPVSFNSNSEAGNSRFLFALLNDNNSTLWMGGIDSKLLSLDAKSNILSNHGEASGVSSIAEYSATKLIYCADYNLFTLDKISGEITPFKFSKETIEQVGELPKVHIIRKYNNTIYFATNNCGLLSYNTSTSKATSHAAMLGQDYSNILSFEVDKRGDVWLATSNGVAQLNMQDNYAKCYEQLGTIKAGSFIKGASLLTRSGEVIFGTLHGALTIQPETYRTEGEKMMQPQITDFKISYNSVLRDSTQLKLDRPIGKVEEFELNYSQNTFSLYFTQIDFSRFENPLYSWRLEGFDEQWSPISAQTYAEYRNVPPGDYKFKLRAYRSQNSNSYVESSTSIRINNPWYWSWYTKTLYLLLFGASIVAGLYLYTQHTEQRQSQERIDSYINILHSLLTPISLLKAPIESLSRELNSSTSAGHLLSVAKKNIERLHSLVSQQSEFKSIISEAQELQELSLNDYFRDLNDGFWEYALLNNVALSLEVKQPNKVVNISREALDKVMDNLLSNAIKYSDRKGEVKITIDYNSSHWSVQIANRGLSIPNGEQKRIFKTAYRADNQINASQPSSGMGLLLSGKLVDAMGGAISFSSNENRGTSFTVRFPMNLAQQPSANSYETLDDTALESVNDIREDVVIGEEISATEGQICEEHISDSDRQFIEQVGEIIRTNLANQDFNIDSLCTDLYMSRSAFYNRMKKITNLTPNEMLRRARMEAAAELLCAGEHSVQTISDMVGFSDAKYFSKVFFKFYGCYPSKYTSSR